MCVVFLFLFFLNGFQLETVSKAFNITSLYVYVSRYTIFLTNFNKLVLKFCVLL